MNVNLHYKYQVWILGLGRIFNSMPAKIAKDILETKLREFGVLQNDDIVALVTDGVFISNNIIYLVIVNKSCDTQINTQIGKIGIDLREITSIAMLHYVES